MLSYLNYIYNLSYNFRNFFMVFSQLFLWFNTMISWNCLDLKFRVFSWS